VVLPAPFEPSKAKMVPRSTSKSTPFRTSSSLYDFSRPCTRIAGSWTRLTVISIPFSLLRSSNRDVAVGRSRADRRALDVRTGFGGAVQLAADLAMVGPQVEVCGGAGGDADGHRAVRPGDRDGAAHLLADGDLTVGRPRGDVAGRPSDGDVAGR